MNYLKSANTDAMVVCVCMIGWLFVLFITP